MKVERSIKAYVFDLGHVIVDVRLDRFLPILGLDGVISTEEAVKKYNESNLAMQFEKGEISTKEFYEDSCRLFDIECDFSTFLYGWKSIIADEDPKVAEIIRTLARKSPVYLLSNTNPPHFQEALQKAPSLQNMEKWFLSYELHCLKPDERIYRKVIEQINDAPEEIFFVDDRQDNVDAARALNINAVQFKGAEHLRKIVIAD